MRRKVIATIGALLLCGGCGQEPLQPPASAPAPALKKIRVGYVGITCEAPIFVAVQNGYFRDEGLDAELVRCELKNFKEALALGGYDITQHLVMYFLKPIEQGLDAKVTAGTHRGCLRVQTSPSSPIQSPKDLRGKRIGVPGMGTSPFIFASRVLAANNIDPSKDVTWVVYPPAELILALDKGELDAIATSEPIGSLLVGQGKVRNIADQATDKPYSDEYCCVVIANGKFLRENSAETAAATRALLKASKWVEANPRAAAKLSVEGKYLASTVEQNSVALSHLRYVPSVTGAEIALRSAAEEMKSAGMLNASTVPATLAQNAFVSLEGVSDSWIESTPVEKLPGAQASEKWLRQQYARLDPRDVICGPCGEPL